MFAKQRGNNNWRVLKQHDDAKGDENGVGRRLIPKERGSTSIVGVSLLPGDAVVEGGELLFLGLFACY